MPDDGVAFLRVTVGAATVSSQVWNCDVEDVDRGSDKVVLTLDDPDSANSDALREGQLVRVELGWETENALAFEGCVQHVRPIAEARGRVELTAYDLSNRFHANPPAQPRLHVGTLEAILGAIVSRHTIPMGEVLVNPMPSWTEEEPLAQRVGQSDWQLVQELAERYRARAFVEVNAQPGDSRDVRQRGGCSRFYFVSEQALLDQDPMGKLLLCPGMGRLLEFTYRRIASGASPVGNATVSDPATGEPATASGGTPATEPPPAVNPDRATRIEGTHGAARARAYEQGVQAASEAEVQPDALRAQRPLPGLPSNPQDVEQAVRQDRTRILGFYGQGLAMGTVFLRAKGPVEIDGLATWAKGRWYVKKVNHVVQRARLDTGATQLTYRTRFEATR
jgi:phage protein D